MKHSYPLHYWKLAALCLPLLLSQCTTTYDAYGNPVQSLDPGAAAIGAIALGTLAFAAGSDSKPSHHKRHRHDCYDRKNYYSHRYDDNQHGHFEHHRYDRYEKYRRHHSYKKCRY